MGECYRVLKPGRWLSLCYHDTSARRWAMLQDLMRDAGFVIDSADAAASIETGQTVVQPVDVEQGHQARPGHQFSQAATGPRPRASRPWIFDAAARQVLCEYLAAHGSATKDRLYDALVSHLVCRGQMQSFDFEALLRSVAEEGPAEGRDVPKNRHRRGAPVWRLKAGPL